MASALLPSSFAFLFCCPCFRVHAEFSWLAWFVIYISRNCSDYKILMFYLESALTAQISPLLEVSVHQAAYKKMQKRTEGRVFVRCCLQNTFPCCHSPCSTTEKELMLILKRRGTIFSGSGMTSFDSIHVANWKLGEGEYLMELFYYNSDFNYLPKLSDLS